MIKISDHVRLSPGFKTAVNLKNDFDNFQKSNGYIITDIASDIVADLADGIRPNSSKRSRLITGTYGTGKSHLSLVLSNLYRFNIQHESIINVTDRLKSKWPGKYKKLILEKNNINKPFLIVLLYGDEGDFNAAVLKSLDKALKSNDKLKDIIPNTSFSAAIKRIEELQKKHKNTFDKLVKSIENKGLISVEVLKSNLSKYDKKTYSNFCDIHEEVCAGAPFYNHHMEKPKDVYSAVSKKLIEEFDYAGIVVLWDEFGRYMDRLVQDPNTDESLEIQHFAEGCNDSEVDQCHLYLICHRSLREYLAVNKIRHSIELYEGYDKDIVKVSGRFEQYNVRSSDREVFELIDQVVIQNEGTDGWKKFINDNEDYFEEITKKTNNLNIFPEFLTDEILQTIVLGSYPLHPLTSYCLPQVSQKVAQNERTMFNFLSYENHKGSLGDFINREKIIGKNEVPRLCSIDLLWDYFSDLIENDPVTKKIAYNYKAADSHILNEKELEKRIIKAIAMLTVVASDRFLIDEEILAFGLDIFKSEIGSFKKILNSISSGKNRIIMRSKAGVLYF